MMYSMDIRVAVDVYPGLRRDEAEKGAAVGACLGVRLWV
jgi:hypothetical protein